MIKLQNTYHSSIARELRGVNQPTYAGQGYNNNRTGNGVPKQSYPPELLPTNNPFTEPKGSTVRKDCRAKNLWHRVSYVFVENCKNQFIM